MITRGIRWKVAIFLMVTVLGVAYVAIRYVKVGEQVTGQRYVVSADFTTGGGIFTHASVTYRGYPVGEVGAVRLLGPVIRAAIRRADSGQLDAFAATFTPD